MKITKKEVEYVAHLARLKLGPGEAESFTARLDEILTYFEKLKELNTAEVEPTSHSMSMANAFREDTVKPGLKVEDALSNAPGKEGNFFKVPRIIE